MLYNQIVALVRQQFTAAEISAQLGCSRADVYSATSDPIIEYVDVTTVESGSKLAFSRFINGEWCHFLRSEEGVERLTEAQEKAA